MFWKRNSDRVRGKRASEKPPIEHTLSLGETKSAGEPSADGNLVVPVPVLRSSLGADTVISGRLSFTVPTRIDGKLRGEVRASEMLVVGEDAVVEAGEIPARLWIPGHPKAGRIHPDRRSAESDRRR